MPMKTIYGKDPEDLRKKVKKLGKEWKHVGNDRLKDGSWAATYTLVKKKPARRQSKPDLFKQLFG